MDGLECTEIQFCSVLSATNYFRLESEFFNAKSLLYPQILKGKDVIDEVQYGTSKYCDEESDGYPVLRLNELHNGFIEIPQKYCHILSTDEFEKLRLKKGDVLIIRTNGNPNLVGQAAVVLEDTDFAFASYLFRVVPNGKINSETLVAYLNCKYGRYEIDKNSMKGNQTNFSPAKFKDIAIPKFGEPFQTAVQKLFADAHTLRNAANRVYHKVEMVLNTIIGIPSVSTNGVSIKALSASFKASGRLDAEYYQPKYDRLFAALAAFTTKQLGGANGIADIQKSIEPGSESYGEEGIPFVRVSDITKFGVSEPEIKLPADIVEYPEALFPKKDSILFSKDGSVGIAYKLEEDAQFITSSALLQLTVRDTEKVLPDYLTLVLNSPVVQLQAEQAASGAVIQHWKPSEIQQVIIPVLDMADQKKLSQMVQESFSLRRWSEQLLDYAKQAVELAIEQGEDAAMAWLKEKGGNG